MDAERIALVLAAGGARGAYEAGALSVVLAELERLGQRPSMFLGTSVGAINAAYCAAGRHRGADEAAVGGVQAWREVGRGRVGARCCCVRCRSRRCATSGRCSPSRGQAAQPG